MVQGPVGVANLHVETAIDAASGKLTMLYQVSSRPCGCVYACILPAVPAHVPLWS